MREDGWLAFKLYHYFAEREDTMEAPPEEYLPDWAWEIAHRHSLILMLHLVRSRAVADPVNQQYIRERCKQFSNARLILAHVARAFCGQHGVEGVANLPLADNIFFDSSAVCDPHDFQAAEIIIVKAGGAFPAACVDEISCGNSSFSFFPSRCAARTAAV